MTTGALAAARRRAAGRYRGGGRFDRGYVAGKLRFDPVYADMLALPDPNFGEAIDVGCGRGQLGLLLLEAGAARSVLGLDRNAGQLAQAEAAAQGLAFRAARRDLGHDQCLPAADTVFLIDVLYQLDTPVQQALLANAAAAARRCVVIRTADPARGLRSAFSRGIEGVGRRFWPNAGARVNPLPVAALSAVLSAAGFAVTAAPCARGTPFANVLLVGRRC